MVVLHKGDRTFLIIWADDLVIAASAKNTLIVVKESAHRKFWNQRRKQKNVLGAEFDQSARVLPTCSLLLLLVGAL